MEKTLINYLIILSFSFFLNSCKSKLNAECTSSFKNGVQIEILNNEIYFVAIDTAHKSLVRFDYTNRERELAKNVIAYKLTNNTKEKLYFAFDTKYAVQHLPSNYYDDLNEGLFTSGLLQYSIENQNEKIIFSGGGSNYSSNSSDEIIWHYQKMLDSLERNKFQDLGYSLNNKIHLEKSFVINPNESKTFKFLISLPLITELSNPLNDAYEYKILIPSNTYVYQLRYFQNIKVVKENLTNDQINELKMNNIRIFEGLLISNPINLIVR